MELEDLKTAWEQLERRVEAAEIGLREYREERTAGRLRRALMRMTAGQAMQAVLSGMAIAVAGPFWIQHRHIPHFLIAGLTLHVYGVVIICSCVLQIVLIGHIYYTESVVMCQRRALEFQRLRVLSSLALGLPWWILWIPVTMVGAERFMGVDLYQASPGWIQLSLIIGLCGIAASIVVARRLAAHPPESKALRNAIDSLSGCSLARTIRQFEEIQRFTGE
jgi:hypothetical protein